MDFNKVQDENRRAELIRVIEHSVEKLTLPELEALYYDLISKDYIRSKVSEQRGKYQQRNTKSCFTFDC